jgi:hypothetical protein
MVYPFDTRPEQEERKGEEPEPDDEGYRRPGEEENRGGVVVPLIGERLPIPLIPFVAKSAIHVDVNELRARDLSHRWGR